MKWIKFLLPPFYATGPIKKSDFFKGTTFNAMYFFVFTENNALSLIKKVK